MVWCSEPACVFPTRRHHEGAPGHPKGMNAASGAMQAGRRTQAPEGRAGQPRWTTRLVRPAKRQDALHRRLRPVRPSGTPAGASRRGSVHCPLPAAGATRGECGTRLDAGGLPRPARAAEEGDRAGAVQGSAVPQPGTHAPVLAGWPGDPRPPDRRRLGREGRRPARHRSRRRLSRHEGALGAQPRIHAGLRRSLARSRSCATACCPIAVGARYPASPVGQGA